MQPLLALLKERGADVQIDVLATPDCVPLLTRMPEVDRGISLPFAIDAWEWGRRYALGQALQREAYRQAFVLCDSFKSALIPFFAEVPLRTGWRGQMRFVLLNDIRLFIARHYPQLHYRFAALGFADDAQPPAQDLIPLPSLMADSEARAELLRERGLSEQSPMVVFALGMNVAQRAQWPDVDCAGIAANCLERGLQVVLVGRGAERRTAAFQNRLGSAARQRCVDLVGQLDLAQMTDLLAGGAVVISDDIGLAWLTVALHRPLIVVGMEAPPSVAPVVRVTASGQMALALDTLLPFNEVGR